MGFLHNTRAYLSGPIQFGNTNHNWRDMPIKILVEEFKINLFDPFADPKQQLTPALEQARLDKDIEKIVSISKGFVRKDLCAVDRADFVIAYIPYKVPTVGTTHEVINSNNSKKPTLLVTDCEDITYIPLWYFGFIPSEFMFANWQALFDYLKEVDAGKHKHNNRWSYVYGEI